ncbi:unnamed protein product, partial [Cyprideis torosa]
TVAEGVGGFEAENQIADRSCVHQGLLRQNGEEWAEGLCTICRCESGDVNCRQKECPPILCSGPTRIPLGECCPICEVPEPVVVVPV